MKRTDITPEEIFTLVEKALPGVKITKDEEKTLLSMISEFIDCEDWRPGKEICDFLNIERRYNKTAINNAIFDYMETKGIAV